RLYHCVRIINKVNTLMIIYEGAIRTLIFIVNLSSIEYKSIFEKMDRHGMTINWQDVLHKSNLLQPTLIHASQFVFRDKLEQKFPEGRIYVCDAYVKDIEHGQEVIGGYEMGRCINIDHHAPVVKMSRIISSTPLAIERVTSIGVASNQGQVVINHTDCDSVLSSAIILGILPPELEFGLAAIAADHTGQSNQIADVLQPCAKLRDFNFSLRNLAKLLQGEQLENEAQELYEERMHQRKTAQELVGSGQFKMLPNGVAWAIVDTRLDGALLPSL